MRTGTGRTARRRIEGEEGGRKQGERERERTREELGEKNIGERDGEGRMSADSRGGGGERWTEEGGRTKRRRGGMDAAGG